MLCARETAPGDPSNVISVGSLLWSIWIVAPENCGMRFVNEMMHRRAKRRASLACQTVAGWQRTSCRALIVSPPLHGQHSARHDGHRLHACVAILSDGEPGRARAAARREEAEDKRAHLPITRPTRSLRPNHSTPVRPAHISADDNRAEAHALQARSPWTRDDEHGLRLVYRRGLPAASGRRKRAQQPRLHGRDACCGLQLQPRCRVRAAANACLLNN